MISSKKYAWQQIPSPIVSELLALDFDGVVIDLEHGCFNQEVLYSCIQALSHRECFVRLTEVSPTWIRWCLDAGVDGLIFSTMETYEQAQQALQLSLYPSFGGKRGLGLVRSNQWGRADLLAGGEPILIAQIETRKGVKLIETCGSDIGFDYYLVGPYDLSASLGHPGDFTHPDFIEAIAFLEEKIGKSALGIHIPKDVENQVERYAEYGFMALGMDTTMILERSEEITK